MHFQERQAWFILIVTAVTVALWLVVVAIFGFHEATFGVFGLFGLAGFAVFIGRGSRHDGRLRGAFGNNCRSLQTRLPCLKNRK